MNYATAEMKMQFKLFNYQFKNNVWYLLLLVACVVTFIKLGLWQYNKAAYKQGIQDAYQASVKKGTQSFIKYLNNPEVLEFQNISFAGSFETQYQILIDNKVEQGRGGFHIVTPFKIKNTDQYILVNRGWIAGYDGDHQKVPEFDTPAEEMRIEGMVWIPTDKIFTLEKESEIKPNVWKLVWQNLDMKKYHSVAPISVLDVIVKLAPNQKGGFVRNWQLPPSKIATNLSYAYQWFGFAFAAIAIFLYQSIRRIDR